MTQAPQQAVAPAPTPTPAVPATAPATNPSNPRPSSVLTFTFIQTHLLSMEKPDFRAKPCHPLR